MIGQACFVRVKSCVLSCGGVETNRLFRSIGASNHCVQRTMTTAKKSARKTSSKTTLSSSKKSSNAKRSSRCWPGFEPVAGKAPGEKGSCKPKPGKKSAAVKRADQKAAAASKLEKQGKPNPRRKAA